MINKVKDFILMEQFSRREYSASKMCEVIINKIEQMKQPYQIRIDTELLDKVKESAKENERSVNAEIRYLLKCALAKKCTSTYKVPTKKEYLEYI